MILRLKHNSSNNNNQKMTKRITLHYFNARGLSEPIRYLLAYKQVDYVDRRFSHEEWPQIKPSMPGGKVPVLEINGKMLSQTTAILVYLANEHGLAGKSSWEIAKLLEIDGVIKGKGQSTLKMIPDEFAKRNFDVFTLHTDISIPIIKWYYEPNESEKLETFENLRSKHIPEALKSLEHIVELDQGSKKFILGGETPTWGDFVLANWIDGLRSLLQKAGNHQLISKVLTEHSDRVQTLPGVKEYIATRPQTES